MKEELIGLEADFANNDYYGTNVWTEEKYRVLSGSVPVLLSAPHSVNQLRGDDVRDAEKYTGGLARLLATATNSFAIFQLFTHADPNTDNENYYKNGIINLVNEYGIKLLIDIHSSQFIDDTDVDIVTNNRQTLRGHDELINKLEDLGIKYNITFDEMNEPNKEKENEIIFVTSLTCSIPAIRLVINNKRLDFNNGDEKINNIIKLLSEFIMQYYE